MGVSSAGSQSPGTGSWPGGDDVPLAAKVGTGYDIAAAPRSSARRGLPPSANAGDWRWAEERPAAETAAGMRVTSAGGSLVWSECLRPGWSRARRSKRSAHALDEQTAAAIARVAPREAGRRGRTGLFGRAGRPGAARGCGALPGPIVLGGAPDWCAVSYA